MKLPALLSVVFVVHNQADDLPGLLEHAASKLTEMVADFELVVIDNASNDGSVEILRGLTGVNGIPNVQAYMLTKEVDRDTATSVGLANALGDYIAVLDPVSDDIAFVRPMLKHAAEGYDVVFATNRERQPESFAYRVSSKVFYRMFKWFSGVNLAEDGTQFRLLSRTVVNFILQHPQPAISYRHLPATGGFLRINLLYTSTPRIAVRRKMSGGLGRGVRLLVSTTRTPLRLVTVLSLLGAAGCLVYSIYAVLSGLFNPAIAPGWLSLSLQQSGMFFLLSLVLLVLSEYIIGLLTLTSPVPTFHIAQEFSSTRMTRREALNVEIPVTERSDLLRD